jgi:hypothetical protein
MSAAADPDHAGRWRLARGHALQRPGVRTARWLRLHEGELWVTAEGRLGEPPPEDWWVAPGGLLRLPEGRPVLAEAWQGASFELLEEARPA